MFNVGCSYRAWRLQIPLASLFLFPPLASSLLFGLILRGSLRPTAFSAVILLYQRVAGVVVGCRGGKTSQLFSGSLSRGVAFKSISVSPQGLQLPAPLRCIKFPRHFLEALSLLTFPLLPQWNTSARREWDRKDISFPRWDKVSVLLCGEVFHPGDKISLYYRKRKERIAFAAFPLPLSAP